MNRNFKTRTTIPLVKIPKIFVINLKNKIGSNNYSSVKCNDNQTIGKKF